MLKTILQNANKWALTRLKLLMPTCDSAQPAASVQRIQTHSTEYPDGEAPVIRELWGIWTSPLQRGKTPTPNEYPRYDTKQSDG